MAGPSPTVPPALHPDLVATSPNATSDEGSSAASPDLIASIETYLAPHNDDPKPYVWAATAEDILAKVQRARTKLDALVNQN